jgi:hypothetical protein
MLPVARRSPASTFALPSLAEPDHARRQDNLMSEPLKRRWYHLRPKPRQRTDLLGFNSTWWMAAVWLVAIALVVYPYPVW